MKADYKLADVTPSQMAMLDYAAKLTSRPSDMIESDLIKLRNNGFNDRSILDKPNHCLFRLCEPSGRWPWC